MGLGHRLSAFGSRCALRSTTEQAHDDQHQATASKGGDVKRDERHDDDEKCSIHGKPPNPVPWATCWGRPLGVLIGIILGISTHRVKD